ncbi:AAA family ATPase [Oscillospiraceae bacterium HV4-5-C5C]|nr:AAA family ATPase [Oscillospiraceae bacterium HV4-5-C5C]
MTSNPESQNVAFAAEERQLKLIQSYIRRRQARLKHSLAARKAADLDMATQIYDEGLAERDQGFAELANLHQEIHLNQQKYRDEWQEHQHLDRLWDNPYFGLLTFAFDDEPETGPDRQPAETYRIGLMNLADDADLTQYVLDWRAPLAAVYYEYPAGPAHFAGPQGQISGQVLEKQQAVIRDGQLLRLFATDEEVQDEILQTVLSGHAGPRMRNIVATLQREQNQLVRVDPSESLLVLGVAGSGKTAVAMHRAAYLLYRQPGLSAQNMLLLTPNSQLAAYVSQVLPDLNEAAIRQETWPEALLEDLSAFEGRYLSYPLRPASTARRTLACDTRLNQALERWLKAISSRLFVAKDLEVGDQLVPQSFLSSLYLDNYQSLPPLKRAEQMLDNVRDYLRQQGFQDFGAVRDSINTDLQDMYLARRLLPLYRLFLTDLETEDPALYRQLEAGTGQPGEGQPLDDVDVALMVLIKAALWGRSGPLAEEQQPVEHLILDEMQDLPLLAHQALASLFTCPKTIMGDVQQALTFDPPADYVTRTAAIYRGQGKLKQAWLNLGYRSTYEISRAAAAVWPASGLKPFERHGGPVNLHRLSRPAALLPCLEQCLRQQQTADWQQCAVLCPDTRTRDWLAEQLQPSQLASVFVHDSVRPLDGLESRPGGYWHLLSLDDCKGLEFDALIVIDRGGFPPELDCQPLSPEQSGRRWYVALTRALHQLDLILPPVLPEILQPLAALGPELVRQSAD